MLNHSSRASWKVFPNKKHPEGLLPVSPASSCPSHLLLATYHSPLGGKPILSVAALPVMAKGGSPFAGHATSYVPLGTQEGSRCELRGSSVEISPVAFH